MSEILIKILCSFGAVFITIIGIVVAVCNFVSSAEIKYPLCKAVNGIQAAIIAIGSIVWLIAALTKVLE